MPHSTTRSSRALAFALGAGFLSLTACDAGDPTSPLEVPAALGAAVAQSNSGGAYAGTEGFRFLPPMAESSGYGGTFDAALQPVVEICATPACDAFHARYTMTQGIGSERVRLSAEQHYMVNWHTSHTGAVTGETYRIRVLVSSVVLGYADATIVSTGREALSVKSDGSIALVANQTLPVRFRIETGIVGAVVVSPAGATIDVGGTQQFSAVVRDLHGAPLVGPTITWSSGDTNVATVDQGGLATGVAAGGADIRATAEQITGSAALTVAGDDSPAAFVTTWDTSLGTGTTVTLALAGTVAATIDWGDGTTVNVTTAGPHVHDYGADGVYTVSVTGTVTAYNSFSNGGATSEREKLVSVDAWGEVGFTRLSNAFHTASNLTSVPSSSDGLENVTWMDRMFYDASSFNHPIGDWNTSSVTTMQGMFSGAAVFNQPIGSWNTGSVRNMNGMFLGASVFNQPIGDWNTGSLVNMGFMFASARAFDQPIGDWDTRNATNMDLMFFGARSFNRDLSGWCVWRISSEPNSFDFGASSWVLPRPDWGMCP
jgi:surface protein